MITFVSLIEDYHRVEFFHKLPTAAATRYFWLFDIWLTFTFCICYESKERDNFQLL